MSTIRHERRPGDLGAIVYLHGVTYHHEYGFDLTFEAYVAEPLARFALNSSPRQRLWVVEDQQQIVGSIAIVEKSPSLAQLCWFIVAPGHRRRGLGRQLLHTALDFADAQGYQQTVLYTVNVLEVAIRLYGEFGFRKTDSLSGQFWGVYLTQETHERQRPT